LIVEYTIAAEHVEKVAELASGSRQVTVRLHDTSNRVLASVNGAKVASSGNINKTRYRLTTALGTLGLPLDSTPLKINVRIDGFEPKSATFASLGHIYDFTKVASKQVAGPAMMEDDLVPKSAALFNHYPNPFNSATNIQFSMPAEGVVTLRIYNLQGQLVRELLHEPRPAGAHTVMWDGRDDRGIVAASGIYFVRLESGKQVKINKLTLVR
jgi:hypothetical protein